MAEAMRAAGFRYERYEAPRGAEWMLVHGRGAPRVLILSPLLGELNATRALLVDLARRLAAGGIGSAIPDLPGCGESVHAIETVTWEDWRDAAAAAARAVDMPHIVALRGGA